MRLDMVFVAGGPVLAGAINGKAALRQLVAATAHEPKQPTPIFLDFAGVEVATASFLRESVLAFRDFVRGRKSTLYPVIANVNEDVRDELIELTQVRGDSLMSCSLSSDEHVENVSLIGDLDPKQRLTFDLVCLHGETDAGTLMKAHGAEEGTKHTTAWNNRLAALATRGLLMEISQGRAKSYRPLF